jgi:hypothetical protein
MYMNHHHIVNCPNSSYYNRLVEIEPQIASICNKPNIQAIISVIKRDRFLKSSHPDPSDDIKIYGFIIISIHSQYVQVEYVRTINKIITASLLRTIESYCKHIKCTTIKVFSKKNDELYELVMSRGYIQVNYLVEPDDIHMLAKNIALSAL